MHITHPIPPALARTIVALYGEDGRAWLARLPDTLAELAQHWSLTLLAPFANLSYNYVLPVRRADGSDAVLKIGVPSPEHSTEIAALQIYAGRGCARLLQADAAHGALLIERIQPGTPLAALPNDDQATQILAQTMRQLWRPVPAGAPFPTLPEWSAALGRLRGIFQGGTGPFPAPLVSLAERMFANSAHAPEQVLLHGDLHHDNILASGDGRGWLAIDPKGLVGDPAYEVGALLYNRLDGLGALRPTLARRIDLLAEALGFERERLICWGVAQAVLSAWWGYEDQLDGWGSTLRVGEALFELLR